MSVRESRTASKGDRRCGTSAPATNGPDAPKSGDRLAVVATKRTPMDPSLKEIGQVQEAPVVPVPLAPEGQLLVESRWDKHSLDAEIPPEDIEADFRL